MRKGGKRRLLLGMVLAVIAATGGLAFFHLRPASAAATTTLPSAIARKGEFQVIVSCRGELVADRSVLVVAPLNVPNLQIVWLAEPGSAVQAGDVIVRFDTSSAKRQLQEKEAALKQSQAQLDEAIAQSAITEEQSRLDIASSKTTAERARLEVSKSEILSALQAEERKVEHSLAEDKLKVQEAAFELVRARNASKIASLQALVKKNQAEVDLTVKRLAQMEVKSPAAGIVSYLMNYTSGWMNAKPFKVGDSVWPGSGIAEIPDLASLRMKAKVEEIERGRIQNGQSARILMDPFPEKPFSGSLAAISPLTEQNFEWPPTRNFRAFASFASIDPRLRPAMNGRLDIIVDRIPNAISVPAKAVFARDGRPVVFALTQDGMKTVKVEVLARNPDEVAIRGIEEGTRVALIDEAAEAEKRPGGGKT